MQMKSEFGNQLKVSVAQRDPIRRNSPPDVETWYPEADSITSARLTERRGRNPACNTMPSRTFLFTPPSVTDTKRNDFRLMT